MADLTDSEAVVESVKAGDHDEAIADLIEAVRLRLTYGQIAMKWKLAYQTGGEDHEVTEDDLTLGESRLVERLSGQTWGSLDPSTTGSECLAIIAAVLHSRHGKELKFTRDGPAGAAWDEASALPATAAAESISKYQADRAPKS